VLFGSAHVKAALKDVGKIDTRSRMPVALLYRSYRSSILDKEREKERERERV